MSRTNMFSEVETPCKHHAKCMCTVNVFLQYFLS